MKDRTVLVTGATDGIGKQTALELARMDARVLIHGRDKDKGARVLEEINRATCNENLTLYIADFSDLTDVRRMADELRREQSELHVLVNNAGNFYMERQLNRQGLEMTLTVNHLAPFLLTWLLRGLLIASAPARVVMVASGAHHNIKSLEWDNLQGEKQYDGFEAYALSKLAMMCCANALARVLENEGVTVNSLHPGVIDTRLLRASYKLEGASVDEGAQTPVFLASSVEVEGVTGKYFSRKAQKPVSPLAADQATQDRFWQATLELLTDYLD